MEPPKPDQQNYQQPATTPSAVAPILTEPTSPSVAFPASPIAEPPVANTIAPEPAKVLPSSPPAVPFDMTVDAPGDDRVAESAAPLLWEASEYVHHEKDMRWFLALMGGGAILLLVAVFLIKSWTFIALIVVMTLAIIVLAKRPPRTIRYQLSAQGIQIDDRHYSYTDFRAFDVINDGGLYSISLVPVKRFMPSTLIFFPPEQGEAIIDTLGSAIPMEPSKPDAIDRLSRYLRF